MTTLIRAADRGRRHRSGPPLPRGRACWTARGSPRSADAGSPDGAGPAPTACIDAAGLVLAPASSTCTPTPTCRSCCQPGPLRQDQPGRHHRGARPGRPVLRAGRRRRAGRGPRADRRLERQSGRLRLLLAHGGRVPRPAGRERHRRCQRGLPGPAGHRPRAGRGLRRPAGDADEHRRGCRRCVARRDGARARSACPPG